MGRECPAFDKPLKHKVRAGDGSVVKNTDCLSRELGFDSQHPHSGSQPSVIPDLFLVSAGTRHASGGYMQAYT